MNTSNVPHLRENAVAEAPKKAESKPDKQLASAAASGDPTVQRLLAIVETHESNGDQDKADEARRELADLGFK